MSNETNQDIYDRFFDEIGNAILDAMTRTIYDANGVKIKVVNETNATQNVLKVIAKYSAIPHEPKSNDNEK